MMTTNNFFFARFSFFFLLRCRLHIESALERWREKEKWKLLLLYFIWTREYVSKLCFCGNDDGEVDDADDDEYDDDDDEKLISITHKHCLLQNALLANTHIGNFQCGTCELNSNISTLFALWQNASIHIHTYTQVLELWNEMNKHSFYWHIILACLVTVMLAVMVAVSYRYTSNYVKNGIQYSAFPFSFYFFFLLLHSF